MVLLLSRGGPHIAPSEAGSLPRAR
jgi:hypothetical protein